MKTLMFAAMIITFASTRALADITMATGIMALSNSTHQGGQGAEGSTFLSQTDISYHGAWWAAGAFFQYDKQGRSEVDTASGPRLELAWKPFYIDFAYGLQMNRSYTDRAIAEQTGHSSTLGLGARFNLTSSSSSGGSADGAGLKGVFLQFSYKMRTQTVQKQDGKPLDQAIIQKDGYPLFGIGAGF